MRDRHYPAMRTPLLKFHLDRPEAPSGKPQTFLRFAPILRRKNDGIESAFGAGTVGNTRRPSFSTVCVTDEAMLAARSASSRKLSDAMLKCDA